MHSFLSCFSPATNGYKLSDASKPYGVHALTERDGKIGMTAARPILPLPYGMRCSATYAHHTAWGVCARRCGAMPVSNHAARCTWSAGPCHWRPAASSPAEPENFPVPVSVYLHNPTGFVEQMLPGEAGGVKVPRPRVGNPLFFDTQHAAGVLKADTIRLLRSSVPS
jgi:hypothetical protein